MIPISQRLLEQVRRQQADVARRYESEQRHYLLPRVRSNPDGTLPYSCATLRRRLARWLTDREIRDASGRPVHVHLDPDGPLSDAAWAKENLARAKQTLPNGSCGLPLQQTCPHPNACLTCDHFLTTTEHLPVHREQLDRTRELLATARERGQQRLIDMNEPVELNLVRIIDGLQRLTNGQPADAA